MVTPTHQPNTYQHRDRHQPSLHRTMALLLLWQSMPQCLLVNTLLPLISPCCRAQCGQAPSPSPSHNATSHHHTLFSHSYHPTLCTHIATVAAKTPEQQTTAADKHEHQPAEGQGAVGLQQLPSLCMSCRLQHIRNIPAFQDHRILSAASVAAVAPLSITPTSLVVLGQWQVLVPPLLEAALHVSDVVDVPAVLHELIDGLEGA